MRRTGTPCHLLKECFLDGITCERCWDSFYGEDLFGGEKYVVTLKDKNNAIQDYVSPQFETYEEAIAHVNKVVKHYSHSFQIFVEIVSPGTFDLYTGPEFRPSSFDFFEKFINCIDTKEWHDEE